MIGSAKREAEEGNLEEEGEEQRPGERGEEPMTRGWNPEESWPDQAAREKVRGGPRAWGRAVAES